MIKLENIVITGWEAAIRGMRNPMNSWDKSDSLFYDDGDFYDIHGNAGPWPEEHCPGYAELGPNDLDLAKRLSIGGPVHGKFKRMIVVTLDITAPLYWWKEFDTYKVGTVANSCSTMHKIHAKEFTLEDFSHEHLIETSMEMLSAMPEETIIKSVMTPIDILNCIIMILNQCRKKFLETQDKRYWWQMIQLLPTSYNQKRTVMLNYEVLTNIYHYRKDHKLDEWHDFCDMIRGLPYAKELIIGEKQNPGTISDGYHTFNDLYEQRMILFSTIVNLFPDISWKTRRHEDGKPCFPDSDYFLVTIETPTGNYGYHFDSAHWDHFQCKEIDKAKPWDGYTDKDAWRLWSLIKMKESES